VGDGVSIGMANEADVRRKDDAAEDKWTGTAESV